MNANHADETRRALLTLLPLIAFAEKADAQDATRIQSQNYHVAFENEKVRVLEYISRPGMGVCGSGLHSHPAHLTVLLSPAKVRIKTPDGKVQEPGSAPFGTVFWSEAETHEVENISGSNIRSLIIELKGAKA